MDFKYGKWRSHKYDWKVGKNYLGEEDGLEKEDIVDWNVGSNNPNLIYF